MIEFFLTLRDIFVDLLTGGRWSELQGEIRDIKDLK